MNGAGGEQGQAAATWEDVDSLHEWARNPRRDQPVAEVAESIRTLGFGAPIVARLADRVVISGHTRLKAARLLGWRTVPVRFLDVSEAQAQALALADNKLGELATWDDAQLAAILKDLQALEIPVADLGWTEDELSALFGESPPAPSAPPTPPPARLPGSARLYCGRCEERLRELADNSVDACVTDPPYGLSEDPSPAEVMEILGAWGSGRPYTGRSKGFMGREWDAFVPGPEVWREVYRVLKPGAHVVAFSGTRTQDWLMLALRMAGFEIRDVGGWAYWTGFPHYLDISKAIDEAAGAERQVIGTKLGMPGYADTDRTGGMMPGERGHREGYLDLTAPATDEAKRWDGWATALKPATEPWVLARKPLDGTVVQNVTKWGTGGLHIDACRFKPLDPIWPGPNAEHSRTERWERKTEATSYAIPSDNHQTRGQQIGRWPANLVHFAKPGPIEREAGCAHIPPRTGAEAVHRTEGSAGLGNPRAGAGRTMASLHNDHPTLKPLRLMAWLAELVTPPEGLLLDPFMGSGTTGAAAVPLGFRFVGIDAEPRYVQIAEARIAHWAQASMEAWDQLAADRDQAEDIEP